MNENATWNTTVSFECTNFETIAAIAHYGHGTSDAVGLFLSSNSPLDHQYESLFLAGNGYVGSVYGQHGRQLYSFTAIAGGNQQEFVDATGGGGAGIPYADFTNVVETIESFRPAGPNHDTLNLSDTSLLTLAQVLHHTTMSDGSATIHMGNDQSVTLTGVTKAQLAANPHDFVFTGGHSLAPTLS